MNATANPIADPNAFFIAGGTLQRDAACYVPRKADSDLFDALLRGEFCYVLTSRQMGKSSLMVRTAGKLKAAGVVIAVLDLTAFGTNPAPEQWYDLLLNRVGRQLDLEDELDDFWNKNKHLPPLVCFISGLRDIVLPQIKGAIVIMVDEVDAVRSLPFSTDEFFAGIRECYNRRAEDPEMNRLTFALFGVASPSDLIQDTRITPFNIGAKVELRDFALADAATLAEALGDKKLLARVFYWTGGHPYLTLKMCREAAGKAQATADIDKLAAELFFSYRARENDDNLLFVRDRLLRSEVERAGLLTLYAKIRRGHAPLLDEENNPLVTVLRLSGIVRAENGVLKVRNRIYARVFDSKWTEGAMPNAELRRQKEAFVRGRNRTLVGAGGIVALVGAFAVFALMQKNRADENAVAAGTAKIAADRHAAEANRLLYVANVNLMQSAWENNNVERVNDLLDRTRNDPNRGFEWDYWNRLCHLDLRTFPKQNAPVSSLAFSPDGRLIAAGLSNATAKVWDVRTGEALLTLMGHTDWVAAIAFSPDGKRIVTGSADATARIWNAATGAEIGVLQGHTDGVTSVAFSPDGRRIATGSRDATAIVWDAATGNEIQMLESYAGSVSAVAFSPDGRRLVTGDSDGRAREWDIATGETALTLEGHTAPVSSVAFSPDGGRILTGSQDKSVKIWDALTGRQIRTLTGHTDKVYAVAFSLDGKRIASGGRDSTARVWEAATGRELLTLKGHNSFVNSVAFSPDGRRLATGSRDMTVRIWEAQQDRETITLRGHTNKVTAVAFSPDGLRLVTGSADETAKVWEAATGRELFTRKAQGNGISSVAFSPDGRRIATGNSKRRTEVWDAETGKAIFSFADNAEAVYSVAFSPDGGRIVTGGQMGNAIVRDAVTGREILALKGYTDDVYSVVFSPDGRRIATGGADSTTKLWDARTGQTLLTLTGHINSVYAVAFSPDGRRIASAGDDHTVRIWDAETGSEFPTLRGHTDGVTSVAFSSDGRRIVTGSGDCAAKVWDAATGMELLTLKRHTGIVYAVAFSPDGKRIVTGSADGTAKIWYSQTEKRPPK